MKAYAGNPNSLADSILTLLFDHQLCDNISKRAKLKVKSEYTWAKIAQDSHFIYQKAICQTMAERQAHQIAQEKARKEKRIKHICLIEKQMKTVADNMVRLLLFDKRGKKHVCL